MGQSQSPEVLVSESRASVRLPTGGNGAHGETKPRRKVFYLVDSLNVGGTEVQAVELATRLDPTHYDVTLGCLSARGPLLERMTGTSVQVCEFYPEGGFDSPRGVYQMLRLA